MTRAVTIYGPDNNPVPAAVMRQARARAGGFVAGDSRHPDLIDWNPVLSSADTDVLGQRTTVAARVHDIARNDGWISGALQKHLDNVIGGGLRLAAKPDFRALGQDADWAAEWGRSVEAKWRGYTEDPGFYCDAARRGGMAGVVALAYRHRLLDGETLAVLLWLPGRGGAYATAVQVVDPDRLSNPQDAMDSDTLRGGVELGAQGEALAYHIRRRHPGEWLGLSASGDFYVWDRVAREQSWGRPLVLHDFDPGRAGQTRGHSPLAPVLKKIRMLGRYDETEMQSALINAIFAAFIESPFDREMMGDAFETSDLDQYQDNRVKFHEDARLRLTGGARIPILYPGEKFNLSAPTRPNTAFADFEAACLRNIAAASGISYEQLTMDWSKTNYSSARAALMEVWKFFTARRATFCANFMTPVYAAWLEEAIDTGEIDIPPGAPDFLDARAAYARARWIGPARGWVDPTKEAQAALMRMDSMVSTLEHECAEQGLDWEEVMLQRKIEIDKLNELGLPEPTWAVISQSNPDGTQNQGGATA